MWTLFRIAALAVVLAVVVPAIAPNTTVGQFFSAVVDDLLGFCHRQPHACHAASRAVDAGRTFVSQQLNNAGDNRHTLTSADRVLQPGGGASAPIDAPTADGG